MKDLKLQKSQKTSNLNLQIKKHVFSFLQTDLRQNGLVFSPKRWNRDHYHRLTMIVLSIVYLFWTFSSGYVNTSFSSTQVLVESLNLHDGQQNLRIFNYHEIFALLKKCQFVILEKRIAVKSMFTWFRLPKLCFNTTGFCEASSFV